MRATNITRYQLGGRTTLHRCPEHNRWIKLVDRLLVLAPGGRDAALLVAQMASAGWNCVSVEPPELYEAIRACRLGTAILTTRALEAIDREELRAALAAQPQWSDCPLILLSSRGYVPLTSRRSIEGFGNVTVLERPFLPSTLVTAVDTALRTRARQRKTEAYLRQSEEAEANVRSLAATLEAKVIARTLELTEALTEQRAAEDQLRQSEERYRLTIELSSLTPWIATPDFQIVSFGKAAFEPSAVPSTRDFRGGQWRGFIHSDDVSSALQMWREASERRQPLDCTFRIAMPNQGYAWHRARASPRVDSDGAIGLWYGTIENIDAQRRSDERFQQLQSELIHVSRVSAMGTMASTLAHELNQPLTAAASYVRGTRRLFAKLQMPETGPIDTALADIDRSVMRAGEIVRRLRELVMLKPVEHVLDDANSVVREACALALIDAITLGISVQLDLGGTSVPILADRVQIQQVLINLLRNAVEALRQVEQRQLLIRVRAMQDACEIVVLDSGNGIPAEVAEKLFTPFNSTKPDGMGIGLSISRTIVEAHGGQLIVESAPGRGAAFKVRLPLATAVTAAAQNSRSMSAAFPPSALNPA